MGLWGRQNQAPWAPLSLSNPCGDHLSAPCVGTAPGLHSCQQHLEGNLDKTLGCHETPKLCLLWPTHKE